MGFIILMPLEYAFGVKYYTKLKILDEINNLHLNKLAFLSKKD